MFSFGLDVDGVTAVSILVKAGACLASLTAAGSALALLGLSRLDDDSARAVRRLAVAGAVAAALHQVDGVWRTRLPFNKYHSMGRRR